jgi:hypothetical protein
VIDELPRGVMGDGCGVGDDGDVVLNGGGVAEVGIGGIGGGSFTGGGGGCP